MKTIILICIDGDHYSAATPHLEGVEGVGKTSSLACSDLIVKVRRHFKEQGDKPVKWIEKPKYEKPQKDVIAVHVTGLWPANIEKQESPEPSGAASASRPQPSTGE